MKAIELETMINQSGTLQIPLDYQQYYGKLAKIIVLLPDIEIKEETVVDLMPFAGQTETTKINKQRVFGSSKGLIKMTEDFDAPLDDFKDYM
jgi:hypothetical protein